MDPHPPAELPRLPWIDLDPVRIAPALRDLGLDPARVATRGARAQDGAPALLLALDAGARPEVPAIEALAEWARAASHGTGALLLFLGGQRSERELAAVRNALWPRFHLAALVEHSSAGTVRRTFSERAVVASAPEAAAGALRGTLLVARPREIVLAPEFTVDKFDQTAAGWNGTPGSPGYPHYRWMRRHVGLFARVAPGARVLDFGCGAGWVGIEAAVHFAAAELCAFDPSPAMVTIARRNAAAAGVARFRARTGFGERPPFPAAGQAPFDLVLSSGVISFAADPRAWLDGLCATVAPGGQLVIGDVHRGSRGFRRRRRERPLLPVREMNALTRDEVRAELERRGFEHGASAAYQLTRPMPEVMHLNETRLAGALTWPLLWANRALAALDGALGSPAQDQFDSWVMRLRRRDG